MAQLLEPFAGLGAKDLAQRLINYFGSPTRALDTSLEQQPSLGRNDAGAPGQPRARITLYLREDIARYPVSTAALRYHRYLRDLLGNLAVEKVHATFLDKDHNYLADEIVAQGNGQDTEVSSRQLVQRALEVGARALILAHNHPSGSSEPSEADIKATVRLRALLGSLEIDLVDHLVVSRKSITCMLEGGYV